VTLTAALHLRGSTREYEGALTEAIFVARVIDVSRDRGRFQSGELIQSGTGLPSTLRNQNASTRELRPVAPVSLAAVRGVRVEVMSCPR
jgi:hypothetical protein